MVKFARRIYVELPSANPVEAIMTEVLTNSKHCVLNTKSSQHILSHGGCTDTSAQLF